MAILGRRGDAAIASQVYLDINDSCLKTLVAISW